MEATNLALPGHRTGEGCVELGRGLSPDALFGDDEEDLVFFDDVMAHQPHELTGGVAKGPGRVGRQARGREGRRGAAHEVPSLFVFGEHHREGAAGPRQPSPLHRREEHALFLLVVSAIGIHPNEVEELGGVLVARELSTIGGERHHGQDVESAQNDVVLFP